MTLTVRLDTALASALERYCADRGVTKSLVVQESLATYLFASSTAGRAAAKGSVEASQAPVSANYQAFADAGFIGAGEIGGGSADKTSVRARAMQRIRRTAK